MTRVLIEAQHFVIPRHRVPRGATLAVIGAFKLAKGILLLALGVDLLRLGNHDVVDVLGRWATSLHIDPDGRHLGRALQTIAALDAGRLTAVTAGVLVYSTLFLTEGTGLLFRKRWAEYFTVIVTGSFIPLELYEIARHPDGLRVAVLVVNVAIVWYLARGLHRGA